MAPELGRIREALSDRFHILECISEGGAATVYLAEDLKHGRKVALKVLTRDVPEPGETARFEREIETIARLRHPHILPLHDSGRIGNTLYFVMPYVSEGTLRDRLRREGPLAVDEALRIAREVAEALARAHAEGVVHRDVKPENIMMESGHAVVSDFGIAFLGDSRDGTRITESGSSPGTPAYMSPEQAMGDEVVDHRTDIYSAGCVLYEMLTGDPPFTGSSGHAIVARKLVDPPPSIRVVREGVPDAVERLTLRTLARMAADRPAAASELARMLNRLESTVRRAEAEGLALPQAGGAAHAPGRLAAMAGIWAAGGAVLLTIIGLLATRVFDYKVQVPPGYAPTRTDYLVVGANALFPFLLYGGLVLGAGFLFMRYALPVLRPLVPRRWRASEADPEDDSRSTWERLAGERPSRAVADLFLVGMVVASVVAFWPFAPIYWALVQPDSRMLACASRDLHLAHYAAMPALIVTLGVARHTLFRWLRGRRAGGRGWDLARWSSAGWLVLLVIAAALPWRVLWNSYYERIRIGDERAYLLDEGAEGLLAYTPSTSSARRFPAADPGLERLGVLGYLFEEPEVFESPLPRCSSTQF